MKLKYFVLVSFILLVISFWNRHNLYENMPVVDDLSQEPLQVEIKEPEFSINVNDIDYYIQPLYDYDIYGMVVSYRHHNSKYGLHKLWNDNLNVADFCLVWRDNAFKAQFDKLDFYSGQFTCNVKTSDRQAWESFNMFQLSNNHLLTADTSIRDKLKDIKIGDQIRIRGWLSSYRNSKGGSRGTSITRDDSGNGACETIYVNQVDILSQYKNGWRKLMYLSLFLFVISLTWYLKTPYRPYSS